MLPQGLKDSSFAKTCPRHPAVTRFNLNKGVCPINSEMEFATLVMALILTSPPSPLPSPRRGEGKGEGAVRVQVLISGTSRSSAPLFPFFD